MLDAAIPNDNFQSAYGDVEPMRSEVEALHGVAILEFGAPWCPICQAAQANIQTVIREHPNIKHIKIEDGSGRPLGRTYRIKLWPTLVVLQNGAEVGRLVRPQDEVAIRETLSRLV
jgi:thioredoxin 1